jgi:hypothetical protein
MSGAKQWLTQSTWLVGRSLCQAHDCSNRPAGPPLSCAISPAAGREPLDVQEDALEVRIRAEGLASLVGELRQQGERIAA